MNATHTLDKKVLPGIQLQSKEIKDPIKLTAEEAQQSTRIDGTQAAITPEEQAERANELVDDYCRLQERVR